MTTPDLHEIERMIDRGETSVAVSILTRAVRSEPVHAAAHALLARALEGEGRWEEAIEAWRQVRVLVPDSPTAVDGLQRALRLRLLGAADAVLAAVAEGLDLETVVTEPDPVAGTDPDASRQTDPDVKESEAATDEEAAGETDEDEEPRNLDELIRELESARIVPDPNVKPAAADDIEPDVDDVVSETLARIYANQRHYAEAARVYDQLAWQKPDRAEEFRRAAAELRAKAES